MSEPYIAIQIPMMPKDTNRHGTIFGGVLLSNIDLAGLPQEKWSRSYGCFGLWVRSYSTGDKNPSDECRRTRL